MILFLFMLFMFDMIDNVAPEWYNPFDDMKKPKKTTPTEGAVVQPEPQREINPMDLEMIAKQEEDRRPADTHIRTIRVLRDEKQFTFQEISDWLKDYGIIVDRNTVYRAYMNHLPEEEEHRLINANKEPTPDN